jgi:7-carboxy-7-deazaguanine synthase
VDGPGGGSSSRGGAGGWLLREKWPKNSSAGKRFVVCTGGEPLLQLDAKLIEALHARDLRLPSRPMERLRLRRGLDWICVSPKAGAELVQRAATN